MHTVGDIFFWLYNECACVWVSERERETVKENCSVYMCYQQSHEEFPQGSVIVSRVCSEITISESHCIAIEACCSPSEAHGTFQSPQLTHRLLSILSPMIMLSVVHIFYLSDRNHVPALTYVVYSTPCKNNDSSRVTQMRWNQDD